MISRAHAEWADELKSGAGTMKPARVLEVPFTYGSRFEGHPNSGPEDLLGAALAGSFSMALAGALERAGLHPLRVRTSADVHLEKGDAGFDITHIDLTTQANVYGIEPDDLQSLAENTKNSCPMAKALRAVPITVDSNLVTLESQRVANDF